MDVARSLFQIDAVFTLARKVEPCVIFIDEIDSFLRQRSSSDNESMALMKAQVCTLLLSFSSHAAVYDPMGRF